MVEHGNFKNWRGTWQIALKIWKQSLRDLIQQDTPEQGSSQDPSLGGQNGLGSRLVVYRAVNSYFFMLLFPLMVICWIAREHYQGCLWPSGCWLFPWIMLATDSLTALCYCLHHLHQFHSFQLGNKYIGLPCVLHGLLQLCNTWLSTYMHGCMVDLCTCNCYPTKDIHVPCKSLKPRANRRVRQPLKGALGACATDNTVAVFIVGFVNTKTDFP